MNGSDSTGLSFEELDDVTLSPTAEWLVATLAPSLAAVLPNDGDDDGDMAAPIPSAPEFEYALMLWYSAFMFIVSGLLFAVTSVQKWRGTSPVYIIKGLDVASYSSLYFAFAVTLVVYNKWLISVWEGGFRFPLTMTLVHMALKMVMSWTVVRGCRANAEIPKVSRWTYYLYACPVGATTALDVAASNASLFYVSVTLYTVIKSTSLVFVLLFSVLYRLQSCSKSLVVVTGIIFGGVIMASYGDSQFDAIGFMLVFVASAQGGYRWALTEVLMSRIGTKMNSLMTIYTISPASVLTLVPFVIWLEWRPLMNSRFYSDPGLFILAILNVCGSGIFAFAMIYVELAVLNRTSSLTLVVIGYLKQMAQIIVSVIVFHEVLSPLNIIGVIVTFLGMGLYARVKHLSSTHGARPTARKPKKRTATVNAREVDDTRLPLAQGDAMDSSFEDVHLDHESQHQHLTSASAATTSTRKDPWKNRDRNTAVAATAAAAVASAAGLGFAQLTEETSTRLQEHIETELQQPNEHEAYEMVTIEEANTE